MISLLYNIVLCCFALVSLPKLLLKREKYRKSFRAKLGLDFPKWAHKTSSPVFWIHAVSVGETRAASSLVEQIKKEFPTSSLVISSTTETGLEEAKRTLTDVDCHFFLPLDFSWTMNKLARLIKPNVLILMEGEFWYHLIHAAKKQGAKILLANGKLSETSKEYFSFIPFFTKRLFSPIDHLCLQSPCHFERFLDMGITPKKITVTGNLKFDTPIVKLTPSEKEYWKEELGITLNDRVVTIGSTHEEEEQRLLDALELLWKEIPTLKVLLVPRHPERFSQVISLLEKRKISFVSYTNCKEKNLREKVVLIDTMGFLSSCYQLSELSLVGGSFIRGIGGHNVFEPIQCGSPVLFGPHMEVQKDFANLILQSGAGRQLGLDELAVVLQELLQNGQQRAHMTACGEKLTKSAQGATARTWTAFLPYF